MIQQLTNPKTPKYIEAKNLANDYILAWYYKDSSTSNRFKERYNRNTIDSYSIKNFGFYSHCLLSRPLDNYYTSVNSNFWESIYLPMLKEIIMVNDLKVNMFCRASLNCTEPSNEQIISEPHYDHDFEHKNLIVYLNDAGGATVIIDENNLSITESFEPTEDSIITFTGLHCLKPSIKKRRIILVATYF